MHNRSQLAATAAWMHQQNILIYPHRLSFAPNTESVRQQLRWIGEDLAECARTEDPFHPYILWDWDPDVEDDEPDESYADLVYMRQRLGPITPLVTPWLPWLIGYVLASRTVGRRRRSLGNIITLQTEDAEEELGHKPPPVLADPATAQAVQDCIRVAFERMSRSPQNKGEPWRFTAWTREL